MWSGTISYSINRTLYACLFIPFQPIDRSSGTERPDILSFCTFITNPVHVSVRHYMLYYFFFFFFFFLCFKKRCSFSCPTTTSLHRIIPLPYTYKLKLEIRVTTRPSERDQRNVTSISFISFFCLIFSLF